MCWISTSVSGNQLSNTPRVLDNWSSTDCSIWTDTLRVIYWWGLASWRHLIPSSLPDTRLTPISTTIYIYCLVLYISWLNGVNFNHQQLVFHLPLCPILIKPSARLGSHSHECLSYYFNSTSVLIQEVLIHDLSKGGQVLYSFRNPTWLIDIFIALYVYIYIQIYIYQ